MVLLELRCILQAWPGECIHGCQDSLDVRLELGPRAFDVSLQISADFLDLGTGRGF
jgi:hypothetical protein